MFMTFSLASFFAEHLGGFLVSIFKTAPQQHDPRLAIYYLKNCLMLILTVSLPLLGAVGFVGLLIGFLVVGPTFSTEVFKPDLKNSIPLKISNRSLRSKLSLNCLSPFLKFLEQH